MEHLFMSQLDSILGMSQLAIIRSEIRGSTVHVWARPKRTPACLYCGHLGLRIKATYCRTLKHSRQGNRLLILHLTTPKYHCLGCNRYFRRVDSKRTIPGTSPTLITLIKISDPFA